VAAPIRRRPNCGRTRRSSSGCRPRSAASWADKLRELASRLDGKRDGSLLHICCTEQLLSDRGAIFPQVIPHK
jgi:hypothetical protein